MNKQPVVSIMWFRRDLRLEDNTALFYALQKGVPVLPVFIFDQHILSDLTDKTDRRVAFIHSALTGMQQQLVKMGSSLEIYYSTPLEAFKQLLQKYSVQDVYTNTDYEQYAIDRDTAIEQLLAGQHIGFHVYKDQVIFEKNEIVKDDQKPYTVFTPYSKKWKACLLENPVRIYPATDYFNHFYQQPEQPVPALETIGFQPTNFSFPMDRVDETLIANYTTQRDFPALHGTSKLGVHLRFGTISIRKLVKKALELNETFLNELIWRDFYQMILWHFPQISAGNAFKKEYDLIAWRNNEADFIKWKEGNTGYPIVDAGMRELKETGFMHNRVRMVVASFLAKHLLIDWRRGEAWFAEKLLDFDFASNNGGWQWAAGCGCDAAPYFRIFNPALQTQKFDMDLKYIRKWVPELDSFSYPQPMVVHEEARKRCLEVYGAVLKKANQ